MATSDDELVRLEAEARYARERFQLYKARSLSRRPSDGSRLRDLERTYRRADIRLRRAKTVPSNN
jgi:hypothetical protein